MKLLFILPEYFPQQGGGIITFYGTWLPQLAAMGHEVKVIFGSAFVAEKKTPAKAIGGVAVEILDSGLREKYLEQFSRYEALPTLRRHLAAAWALAEQAAHGEGYDLVETTDWGLLFVPWVFQKRVPAIVQMHGSCGQIDLYDPIAGEELQGEFIRLLEKTCLARADVVQTNSRGNADFWQNQLGRSVDMLPPVLHSVHQPGSAHARGNKGLVVGRVQQWKGPHILCEALRMMGKDAPELDWVGRDTSYAEHGQTTSTFLGKAYPEIWNQLVLHKPQLPPEDIAKRQAQASFVLVPSTWDVFNFTCVEAMAAGTPVICSTGAGASQWIENGVNGFLFENKNARALAETLQKFQMLTETQRIELGARGQSTILEIMNTETIAASRVTAFSKAIQQHAERDTSTPMQDSDWLAKACKPDTSKSREFGFLDHLPMKKLARYLLQRGARKTKLR